MKKIARAARRRKITDRIVARVICAASAEARDKKISIMAEINPRGKSVDHYVDAVYGARSEAIALREAITGLLEGKGIDLTWLIPIVKPGRGSGVIILDGVTSSKMPKETETEVRKIRASLAEVDYRD